MKPEYSRGSKILNDTKVIELIHNAENYCIYKIEGISYAVYISEELYDTWKKLDEDVADFCNSRIIKHEEGYLYVSAPGYKLYTPIFGPYPEDQEEAMDFARALKVFCDKYPRNIYPNLLYDEKLNLMLPLYTKDETAETASEILGKWLSDGIPVDAINTEKVQVLCQWLEKEDIEEIILAAGIKFDKNNSSSLEKHVENCKTEEVNSVSYDEEFQLQGREELTKFFNEQIIDYLRNKEDYNRMGISSLPATLLYGRPGSGKTYAVQQLATYLKLPCFEINSSSVASPYIHDTSKKISEMFSKAIEAAPSILIIDEMEAYLTSRSADSQSHRVEEVDEFLRNIPKAIESQVIIFAMTNHIDMIDKAVLRKGRFDQIIEVGMPTKKEVLSVLTDSLNKLPCEDNIDLDQYAEILNGRPMSDVAFVIREASRIAVRNRSKVIKDEYIDVVVKELISKKKDKQEQRKIGF